MFVDNYWTVQFHEVSALLLRMQYCSVRSTFTSSVDHIASTTSICMETALLASFSPCGVRRKRTGLSRSLSLTLFNCKRSTFSMIMFSDNSRCHALPFLTCRACPLTRHTAHGRCLLGSDRQSWAQSWRYEYASPHVQPSRPAIGHASPECLSTTKCEGFCSGHRQSTIPLPYIFSSWQTSRSRRDEYKND